MLNCREILRLAHEGITQRQIAVSVGSSRNKVSEVLEMASAKQIIWPLEEAVTNAQLEEILFPDKYYSFSNYLTPDFEHSQYPKCGYERHGVAISPLNCG